MIEVSVIIVCMNRPDTLYPCLDGIKANTTLSYEIIVVAYMFSPSNLEALRRDYPEVKVLVSESLRGFSENNNLALKEAEGKFCFIVNDDTLMEMPVIDALVADFEKLPENAAIVSPKILFPDGKVQTSGRAPWTAWRYMRHYIHLVDETAPSKWSMQKGLFRTWTVNGACFLIRTDVFEEAGWFDERFTFTPEDIALGQKVNELGYTVWSDDDVLITHFAGSTVSRYEAAIKPTRVRGALIFYSGGSKIKYFFLGIYVWLIEALRYLKYLPLKKTGKNGIMFDTSRNVMHSIFTSATTKEIFARYYNSIAR